MLAPPPRFSTDPCSTMALYRHLCHNRSMSEALYLECQSDPHFNCTMRKKWWTHKTLSWFANRKIYLLLHLLVVIEKKETEHEKWVYYYLFYCSSCTYSECGTPLWSLLKNGYWNFWLLLRLIFNSSSFLSRILSHDSSTWASFSQLMRATNLLLIHFYF